MDRAAFTDGGAYVRSEFVAINKTATAAGAGDNTEVDGAWVDRQLASGDGGFARSAKLVVNFTSALGQDETLSFAVQFRDATSSGGAGAADFLTAVASAVAATGDSGGSTETGTFEVDIDLSGARQFVQAQITPNLSASGTDTTEWSSVLLFFGDRRQPVTKAGTQLGSATSI